MLSLAVRRESHPDWRNFFEVTDYSKSRFKQETIDEKHRKEAENAEIDAPFGALTGVVVEATIIDGNDKTHSWKELDQKAPMEDFIKFLGEVDPREQDICGIDIKKKLQQLAIQAGALGIDVPFWFVKDTGSRANGFIDPVAIYKTTVSLLAKRLGIMIPPAAPGKVLEVEAKLIKDICERIM